MFLSRGYLLISVLAAVSGMPRRSVKPAVPMWYFPCGEDLGSDPNVSSNSEKEVDINLDNLKIQHRLTMSDYLNRDYEYLYEGVANEIKDHQHMSNWIPGKREVHMIKKLMNANQKKIVSYLPKLHEDLQKFAVAFEELLEDETKPKIYEALDATHSYLTMMLCEVESSIVSVPSLRLPKRVKRSIMSHKEREPADETRRLVRDWGVLLKYKNYLHAWRHVFDY